MKPDPKSKCCGHPKGCGEKDDLRAVLVGIQRLLQKYRQLKKAKGKRK